MQTVNTNSMLAKLLATENITVQRQSGIKTAMFDLKNRVLMLPVWQDISTDLEHLLLGHETGHALDTPSADTYKAAYEKITKNVFGDEKVSELLASTVRGFLNVIEDARIDKRQKRRYPGLRKNYLLGYKELIDRDFFGTSGRDINSMNFIDRLNIYFKGGNIHYSIEFSPEEKSYIKRVENLETFDEVVSLTEEIYLFCKNKMENETDIGDDIELGDGEGDNDDYIDIETNDWDDGDSDDESEDGDTDGDGEGEGVSTESSSGEGDIGDNGSETTTSNGAGAGSDDDVSNVPESETDRAWEEKSQELVRDENCDYIYMSMPDVDWNLAVDGYKKVLADWKNSIGRYGSDPKIYDIYRREMTEWKMKEKETISFLVKEFEQRKAAEMYSRISVAKTGVIDTNKLHSYKYNDDIFRRLSVLPEGKNHGFVMFLDWSGSMAYNLKHTMKQLFTLVLFCKQIQVPFEVYAFKDSCNTHPFIYGNKQNCMKLGNVVLRQFLSSKMNVSELNDAMTHLWAFAHNGPSYIEGMSGTPLNEAVILAPKIINDFRTKNKLQIVNAIFLTDGESNGMSGLVNENHGSGHYSITNGRIRQRKYFYADKTTGKSYQINPYGWGNETTATLLKIVKEQTGCNLIGFFLFAESFKRFADRFNIIGHDFTAKVSQFWKENKFYAVKSEGYDEYYVIDSKAMTQVSNTLEIGSAKSTKTMAKAFSKFAAKKTINRILLRNFIKHVTEQSKKTA